MSQNTTKASFNWFPGHMNKALKEIEELIVAVDFIVEIVDARAPFSTRNPMMRKIGTNKKRLFVLTKGDLADSVVTKQWMEYFKSRGDDCYLIDKKNKNILPDIEKIINKRTEPQRKAAKKKGIDALLVNVLVVGIPNVGKSTFISKLIKNKKIKIANMPGVTRGFQRFNLTPLITLIDTPGILPSKFDSEIQACNCVAANAIKIDVIPKERFATRILKYIYDNYPNVIETRYKTRKQFKRPINYDDSYKLFEEIARRNGLILFQDIPDVDKSINLFIRDLLGGKFEKVSFEKPLDIGDTSTMILSTQKELEITEDFDNTIEW
ncbi:ribosome biogenesis GTPase YlqF [Spiroplasma endosymbiont of Othius punctulatus]|uniref:ribosome biogenesis GTPase YlqF n=1 Tax=Spiroplasma endosymbiont of Othius punctulatus TaxID=3066289 RepID=UPI0030D1C1E9